jgi:hypothetical protein
MFSARLRKAPGVRVGESYSGYVPEWMPGEHYGDYVMLDIDVATGQILNWKPPTRKQLANTFKTTPRFGYSSPKPS